MGSPNNRIRLTWRTPLSDNVYVGSCAASMRSERFPWGGFPGTLTIDWDDTVSGTLALWACNEDDESDAADISSAVDVLTQPAGTVGNASLLLDRLGYQYVWAVFTRSAGSGGMRGRVVRLRIPSK